MIVIKNTKMPINCTQCPCCDDEVQFCKAANEYIPMFGKPNFCPLVEVEEQKREASTFPEKLQLSPERHGKWVTDKDGYPHCSECGFSYGCIQCWHDEDAHFCPNCGARMDKE